MPTYEYIRIQFDWSDLAQMNFLSSAGWKVVAVVPDQRYDPELPKELYRGDHWALLERPIYQVVR